MITSLRIGYIFQKCNQISIFSSCLSTFHSGYLTVNYCLHTACINCVIDSNIALVTRDGLKIKQSNGHHIIFYLFFFFIAVMQ